MARETAETVARLPVDMAGFVFAESRRRVEPRLAGELVGILRDAGSRALAAGVFVDADFAAVAETIGTAGLQIVQLHGRETPDYCHKIKEAFPEVRIFKVFAPPEQATADAVRRQLDPYLGRLDAVMLDTAGGGTGRTFDWERIPVYRRWADDAGLPLIVAGGLNPGNVESLIERYRPDGVDVSSGVETDGKKDPQKIIAFIERVKTIDRQRT